MERIILEHAPGEVVRALLIQLAVGTEGTLYASWPVFVDQEPDEPDNCITVEEMLGGIDGKLGPTGEVIEHYGFHIMVRSARVPTGTDPQPGYRVGRNKIDEICTQLDQHVDCVIVTIDSATYTVHAAHRISSVNPLGKSRANSARYSFSVDYQITITQTV